MSGKTPLRGTSLARKGTTGKGGRGTPRSYLKNLKVVDRNSLVAESRARAQNKGIAVRKDTTLGDSKILDQLFDGPTVESSRSCPKVASKNHETEPTTPKSSGTFSMQRRQLLPVSVLPTGGRSPSLPGVDSAGRTGVVRSLPKQTKLDLRLQQGSAGVGCSSSRTPADPAGVMKPAAKNVDFPAALPGRVSVDQIEELLCSPAKSPIRKVEVNRSPRKSTSPMKHPSPMRHSLLVASKPTSTVLSLTVDVSQFQAARAALHTGRPTTLLCREKEVGAMSTWLDNHMVAAKPGSIYVSGAPGTGKTATLVSLLAGKVAKYRSIFINCMVLKSSIAIYHEVASKLCPGCNPKTEKAALKIIEKAVTSSEEMVLLVLDEVDQLESRDQTILYTVFEWPALQDSKLALVGIANSLDLTARVLPRLKVKEAYQPTLLHYPPYTKQQLIFIITARLKEGAGSESTAVITPRAIAFLASKISALSGDLRKALDACRRALELAESDVRKQILLKPMKPTGLANLDVSPCKGYKSPKVLPKIGQVDLPQIMKVVNQVYGSPVITSLGTKGKGLPVQQKILVASLLLMVKRGRTKEVTLGKLIDTYSKVLKKRNMKPELESSCVGVFILNFGNTKLEVGQE